MKLCRVCRTEIPQARLEIIPHTETCVSHSSEKPKRAFISGSAKHKMSEVIILDGEDLAVTYWEDLQQHH